MVNRHDVESAMEEWRDQCVDAGIDQSQMLVLFDDNLRKDLARYILTRVRENS